MICLLTEMGSGSAPALQKPLEALLAPAPLFTFSLPGEGAEGRHREGVRAHLRCLLPHAEIGILGALPEPDLLRQLLLGQAAWIAPDTHEIRAQCGAGVHYVPALQPECLAAAVRHLQADRDAAETVRRKGRAQARRLARRLPSQPGIPTEPDAGPAGAAGATGAYEGAVEWAAREAVSLWFPLSAHPPRPRPEAPAGILALVLADDAPALEVTLDHLEAAAPIAPAHTVVVLRTPDPEVEKQVQSVCRGRAEVVQPGPPYRHGRLLQAGLARRRATDGYAFWIENGWGLGSPQSLARLQSLLPNRGWACAAPGGLSRGREHPELRPGSMAGLAQVAAPGTLWSLDWLTRLGGPAEALEAPLAETDLYLRLLRAGGRGGVEPESRRQWLPLPAEDRSPVPLRCGLLTPALELGGAERWIISLLQATDARIAWQGVALTLPHRFHPEIRAEVEACCPVLVGETGVADLSSACDLLVLWGVEGWRDLLPEDYRGAVVLVSHGADRWTAQVFQGSEAAQALVAVSEVALQPLAEPERGRAWVVQNAVDPARVVPRRDRAAVRAAWGVAPDARVLGFLARFTPEKDPLAVARTVRYLPPEWVGVMVGWVPDLPELQRQAEAIAPGRLRWPGPTEDVGSALSAMDTLLVASEAEGFCYALAEAWLARVPVVSTRVGIAREYPELVREIPFRAHGAHIAAALLTEIADAEGTAARVARAHTVARDALSPARFGRCWSGALLTAAGANPWGHCRSLPGIQVVITGYNVEPWLERCLESVEAALAGTRWALLLADDASTDRTWELIRAHRSHAEVVRRQRFPKAANAGQAKNRALGLGLSLRKAYPAILFMDADDVMPRERVTHLLRGAVEGAHPLVHGALRFNAAVADVEAGAVVPPTEDQHHRLNIGPPATVVHESLVPPDGRLFCEDLDALEDGELLCRWELAGIVSAPLPGPVIHEYWPRTGSVMWNERLAENQRRFWQRVHQLRTTCPKREGSF